MSTCLQQKRTKGISPTLGYWVSVPGHGSCRCYQCKWAAALLCPRRTEPPEPKAVPGALESAMIQRSCVGRENVMFFTLSKSCFVLFLWEENSFSVGAELTWNHLMVLIEKWHLCREETLPALTAAVQGEIKALWTWGCARSSSFGMCQVLFCPARAIGPGGGGALWPRPCSAVTPKTAKTQQSCPSCSPQLCQGSKFRFRIWVTVRVINSAPRPAEYGYPNPSGGWFKTLPH